MTRRGGEEVGMDDVPIRDAVIRLGQFLKLAGAVDSGSDVKHLVAEGDIKVNGLPESRRGRQLVKGDVVAFGDSQFRVS
jgi:ribosome-associated protein